MSCFNPTVRERLTPIEPHHCITYLASIVELMLSTSALSCCNDLCGLRLAFTRTSIESQSLVGALRQVDCEMLFARFDVDSDGLLDEEETKRHMAWFNEVGNQTLGSGQCFD